MGAKGDKGDPGADGVDGADGKDGADGLDVVASTLCIGSVPNSPILLTYSIVEYSNGDAFVNCSVADGFYESSASSFFDAKQVGAHQLGCYAVRDDGDGDGGYWAFTLNSGTYNAEYKDVTSGNDGYRFVFAGADAKHDGCTTREL
jgi:hypothetical protein